MYPVLAHALSERYRVNWALFCSSNHEQFVVGEF